MTKYKITLTDKVGLSDEIDLSEFHPSSSALPHTDEKWDSKTYIEFLKDEKTKEETKLSIKYTEIDKIDKFTTKEDCHRYRLKLNKPISWLDTFLVLFDNILKILPVVMLSSLPILFLKNINSQDFDINLLYEIYGIMLIFLIISVICRSLIKNKSMTLDQYLVAVNKKEEYLVKN